jgi:hypothetical protein
MRKHLIRASVGGGVGFFGTLIGSILLGGNSQEPAKTGETKEAAPAPAPAPAGN